MTKIDIVMTVNVMKTKENMMLREKFLFTDQKRNVPLYKLYTSVVRNECIDILL